MCFQSFFMLTANQTCFNTAAMNASLNVPTAADSVPQARQGSESS